jgi:hypothetical protein
MKVGDRLTTFCGRVVVVTEVRETFFFALLEGTHPGLGVFCYSKDDGKKMPRGGTDPFDLAAEGD